MRTTASPLWSLDHTYTYNNHSLAPLPYGSHSSWWSQLNHTLSSLWRQHFRRKFTVQGSTIPTLCEPQNVLASTCVNYWQPSNISQETTEQPPCIMPVNCCKSTSQPCPPSQLLHHLPFCFQQSKHSSPQTRWPDWKFNMTQRGIVILYPWLCSPAVLNKALQMLQLIHYIERKRMGVFLMSHHTATMQGVHISL